MSDKIRAEDLPPQLRRELLGQVEPPKSPAKDDVAHVLFLELVAKAGLPVPRSKSHADGELMFVVEAAEAGEIPDHLRTERGKPRRWAFDYAWPCYRIAIERQGGVWRGGRGGGKGRGGHSGGAGQLRDMEKFNAAQILGWRVLLYTPEQLCTGLPVRQLQELMADID